MFIQGPPTDGPNALWGDLMSTAATARGLQGAIVDGRVRDIRGLREVGFPASRDLLPVVCDRSVWLMSIAGLFSAGLCERHRDVRSKVLRPTRSSTSLHPLSQLLR
jgi:hypothetical protein